MFAIVFAALFAVAAAIPTPDACVANAAGTQQCCNTVASHNDPTVRTALTQSGILDLDLDNLIGDIGIGCAVGSGCEQTAVCCNQVTSNSTIFLGCNGINAL
ncbi:hypothetical protein HGRIS_004668 [Hohenbuehelia grisea]|uniref:Hydrophobin n=1 Tax=Hohenbuehelia grisea TaxID=104357 RepID=A0ABR3JD87_9AGAR